MALFIILRLGIRVLHGGDVNGRRSKFSEAELRKINLAGDGQNAFIHSCYQFSFFCVPSYMWPFPRGTRAS